MSASMSKRQQARNEQDLQHLIISVAGNDRCADCQARNPGWASWSLGIFLCMRCAAIHRKLGTHISKVKSLSMDTWTPDQVAKMRQNGNASVNKVYNPKNIKPGIPIDVDEVDSAMERFIRQKYQERSLADGRPRPPSRDEVTIPTRSQQPSPPLLIHPPKRGKIFGFKLRASSSAYPASKHGARNLPPLEPTVDNAFQAEVRANKPSKPRASNESEKEKLYEDKLEALREMGFTDDERSLAVLKRLDGDLGRTIESLLRLGGSSGPVSRISTPIGSKTNTPSTSTFHGSVEGQVRNGLTMSQNPFNQPSRANTFTVPQTQGQHSAFRNPSDAQGGLQNTHQSINQAFQAMQVSQPLFPHSTGGYPIRQPPVQDSRFQHSMTPPIPHISQQYEYASSPSPMNNTNPFYQTPPTQGMGISSDSYLTAYQTAPFSAPPSNPFLTERSSYEAAHTPLQSAPLPPRRAYSNPFGIPPSTQTSALQPQSTTLLDNGSTFSPANAAQQSFYQQDPQTTVPPPSQSSISPPQPGPTYQQTLNPYQAQQHPQQSPVYPLQPLPMRPQQTGRLDKQSILALYNRPHVAPQPMPTILDDPNQLGGTGPLNLLSSTPQQTSNSDTMANGAATPARRSTTMPVSTTSNLTGPTGSKNPFVSYNNSTPSLQSSAVTSPTAAHPPTASNGTMHRHVSQESVSITNLESGRHSPDAFANLSARFVRG